MFAIKVIFVMEDKGVTVAGVQFTCLNKARVMGEISSNIQC